MTLEEMRATTELMNAAEDMLSTAQEAGFDTWPGDAAKEFRDACERARDALERVKRLQA